MSPRLLQSKLYFRILGILYYIKDTNLPITVDIVKKVFQTTHIFNSIVLASQPCIIKAVSKSDMVVIQINIQDAQSGSKAKSLINRYFNISSHITTIQGMNINPGILQYKNCWKQKHITFAYYTHKSKYVKCNSPHKVKYYREIVWCYKTNFKTNSSRLGIKKEELYSHLFKYINCKEEY